jgi:GMP synthase (glutamine-hydrolysing)
MIREAIGDAWPGGYAVVDARAEAPPAPDGAAAFVITGSASSVPSREPWIVATEAWLREVARARTPALGICFGHQILAQALGGEVRRNPRGREIGTIRVERRGEHADPLFAGVPEVFEANATHVDTVARLPPGATSLARSTLDDHHAIRFADALYGLQFHPEFDASIMRGYLEARRDVCRDEGIDADALRERVLETAASRGLLGAFVRRFVTRAI